MSAINVVIKKPLRLAAEGAYMVEIIQLQPKLSLVNTAIHDGAN